MKNFSSLRNVHVTQGRSLMVSLQENFVEVEIFELQIRTERKIFFRPVLFVSPLCACPMRKISLAKNEKPGWKSGFKSDFHSHS